MGKINTVDDLKRFETHFAFGQNWADYAETISTPQIEQAELGLNRLLAGDQIEGKTMLDIGCGSGIHSLAALRLGARHVTALDLDPDCVRTTETLIAKHRMSDRCRTAVRSVFDLALTEDGLFDVVYSWGVLHHTGDLRLAIRTAASLVAPSGLFIFAVYRKTPLCTFWKVEKRWYSRAPNSAQRLAQGLYTGVYRTAALAKRAINPSWRPASGRRGMDFRHDIHDWLGGYPYESIHPGETDNLMRDLGFTLQLSFLKRTALWGILGSGCDEYCYRRLP